MENAAAIQIQEKPTGNNLRALELRKLFPGITRVDSENPQTYVVSFNNVCPTSDQGHTWPRYVYAEDFTDSIVNLFNVYNPSLNAEPAYVSESLLSYLPCLDYFSQTEERLFSCNLRSFEIEERKPLQDSLFTVNNGLLTANLNDTNNLFRLAFELHRFKVPRQF